MKTGRAESAIFETAREKMRQIKMVRVWVSLEAVFDVSQRTPMHLDGCHNIRPKVNQ